MWTFKNKPPRGNLAYNLINTEFLISSQKDTIQAKLPATLT